VLIVPKNLEAKMKVSLVPALLIALLCTTAVSVSLSAGGPQAGGKPIPAPSDVAAPPKDAQKTTSGLASKILVPGKGKEHPTGTSQVTVHYSGWTTDGKMFDSSVQRNQPATFPLNGVIKGWTEGVQLMVVGEKRRFWIPGNLAYDNSTRTGVPKGMLVFDIELLSFK
jgi:peptidylprolyl isomerase